MTRRVQGREIRLACRQNPALGNPEIAQAGLRMHGTRRPEILSRQPRTAVDDRPHRARAGDEAEEQAAVQRRGRQTEPTRQHVAPLDDHVREAGLRRAPPKRNNVRDVERNGINADMEVMQREHRDNCASP